MRADDLLNLRIVSDPRLDPSGTRVAFVVSGLDGARNQAAHSIWLALLGVAEPRPLTAVDRIAQNPRWSPDGSLLAFISVRDGPAQLYVLPLAGGEARQLTTQAEGVEDCAWSPDGRYLAYSARVPEAAYAETDPDRREPRRITTLFYRLDGEGWTFDRPRQVFVVDVESGESTQLTDGARDHDRLAWRPDGQAITFVARPWDAAEQTMARELHAVDRSGGITQVTHHAGLIADAPSWSPDGSRLAYRVVPIEGYRSWQIAVLDVPSGESIVLTESLERNCHPFIDGREVREQVWLDTHTVVFGVEDAGCIHLYSAPADGLCAPKPLVEGELAVTGFDICAGRVAYTASTPSRPSELFVDQRQLTFFAEQAGDLVEPLRFAVTSPAGGEIDAWLVLPRNGHLNSTCPLILCVHGGPFWQFAGFWPEFQILAEAGYAVVYANPHGSSGKDRSWAGAIRGPNDEGDGWGSVDYEDLMVVLDATLERWPSLDADRVGIMGQSYGGYMTAWAIGQTDRFAAAWAENPVIDLVSVMGTADICTILPRWTGALPYGDQALADYWRRSPLANVANVQTPLLLAHSTEDFRCPFGQAQEMFAALRLLGRDAELLVFPGSHDFADLGLPAHRLMRLRALLAWWDRYLGIGATKERPAREKAID